MDFLVWVCVPGYLWLRGAVYEQGGGVRVQCTRRSHSVRHNQGRYSIYLMQNIAICELFRTCKHFFPLIFFLLCFFCSFFLTLFFVYVIQRQDKLSRNLIILLKNFISKYLVKICECWGEKYGNLIIFISLIFIKFFAFAPPFSWFFPSPSFSLSLYIYIYISKFQIFQYFSTKIHGGIKYTMRKVSIGYNKCL